METEETVLEFPTGLTATELAKALLALTQGGMLWEKAVMLAGNDPEHVEGVELARRFAMDLLEVLEAEVRA